jgi:WD40 repeat protein
VAGRKELLTLTGHKNPVLSVTVSPDSKMIATASFDTTIKLWRIPNGDLLATLSGHTERVTKVDFSADGRTLASVSSHTVKLWNLATYREVATFSYEKEDGFVLFSPDGQSLAFGGAEGPLHWLRAPTLAEIDGHAAESITVSNTAVLETRTAPTQFNR